MSIDAVYTLLKEGVPLLTATRRLAREWRRRYDAYAAGTGAPVWSSALVLPLEAWMRRAWEDALDAGALGQADTAPVPGAIAQGTIALSEAQARVVWEGIVADSPLARGMLRSQAAAGAAYRAWRMLAQWRLPVPASAVAASPEQRAFAEWAQGYARLLRERGWSDPSELPERLLAGFRNGAVRSPDRLLIAGFERRTPLEAALLDALSAGGSHIESVSPPAPPVTRSLGRLPLADSDAECWAAARWARHWLEQEPDARIGIVVPDLTAYRARLVRALEDVLLPAAVLPSHSDAARPFNVSQGLPFADLPMVAMALHLLRLTPGTQPLEHLSAMVRTPFLGGAETEQSARARLDVRLRGWGAAELRLSGLQSAAADGETPAAPALGAILGHWRRLAEALPSRQSPAQWAQSFADLLQAWGWPGEREPDSFEFQTQQEWSERLHELARLETVLPLQTRTEALAALKQLAQARWQPLGVQAQVELLDVHEAAESDFDHLWVMGLHEDVWPPAPAPSPYLPVNLQRMHGMPRVSLEHELALARSETERLRGAAPDVVFSHPGVEGERPLRPSPLIRDLPVLPTKAVPGAILSILRDTLAQSGSDGASLEAFDDSRAPAVVAGTPVQGGTGLFQDQAACPFRAFAHHRLHARAPEAPEPGLDARARGTLVHAALEQAWQRIGDHAGLLALDESALEGTIEASISAALEAFGSDRPQHLTPPLATLERERLRGLLRDWLRLERQRSPFAVDALEQRRPLEIGGITVTGRVDRIDRLPDGRQVLIDYKSGRANPGAWWSDRPDEPQLPLYAASGGYRLAGVAFALVRRQSLSFRGVQDADVPPAEPLFPGATPLERLRLPADMPPFTSLDAVVDTWRETLQGLAHAYRQGDARVAPKRADTCTWCDLPGLCRIAELSGLLAADDDAAGDAGRDDG